LQKEQTVEATADLVSAIAEILWPVLFVAIIILLRREIRSLLQPGAEFVFELAGGKVSIKPTKPPRDKAELPAIPVEERLPADYLYINHTSFLREDKQSEFRSRTGARDLPHYDIRVIVD
jgi:hypothetical protein